MVFHFELEHDSTDSVYMGRDKFENEILIENCCEYDIWFHVDHLSSAHVYLRTTEFKSKITEILKNHYFQYKNFQKLPFKEMEQAFKETQIPEQVLQECGQLVKGNSIKGVKEDAVDVIYTPCWNLKKTKGMETGSVMFMKDKLVKKVRIERDTQLLKKLTKTKSEETEALFKAFKIEYHANIIEICKKHKEVVKQEGLKEKKKQTDKDNAYADMFENNEYKTNKDGIDEDDFM